MNEPRECKITAALLIAVVSVILFVRVAALTVWAWVKMDWKRAKEIWKGN